MTSIDKMLLAFVVVQVAFVLARSFELNEEEIHYTNGEVSEAEECDVKYEKVGCFKDMTQARTLSVLILNDRKTSSINWGAWKKYLKSLACRCAEKSSAKGYDYFGLQFYGECWSDPAAAVKFDHYGRSEDCMGIDYKQCDDEESRECVGGANKNYVYRVVEKGGSGSRSGFVPNA